MRKLLLCLLFPLNLAAQNWGWYDFQGFAEYDHGPQSLTMGRHGDLFISAFVSDSTNTSVPDCEFGSYEKSSHLRRLDLAGNPVWDISSKDEYLFRYTITDPANDVLTLGWLYDTTNVGDSLLVHGGDGLMNGILRFSEDGILEHSFFFQESNAPVITLLGDPLGNYYVIGFLEDSLAVGDTVLYGETPYPGNERFILYFNSDDQFLGARKIILPYYSQFGMDPQGNFIFSGTCYTGDTLRYNGTVLADGSPGRLSFVLKADSDLNLLWSVCDLPNTMTPELPVFDRWGNIFVNVTYSDSVTVGGVHYYDTLYSSYYQSGNILLIKYSAGGNFLHATEIRDPYTTDEVRNLTSDKDGNIFFYGVLHDTTLNIGDSVLHLPAYHPYAQSYLARLDTAGYLSWKLISPYDISWHINNMCTDDWNNLYMGILHEHTLGLGNYYDSVPCSFSAWTASWQFVVNTLEFNPVPLSVPENIASGKWQIAPNPSTGDLLLSGELPDHSRYRIFDMTGRILVEKEIGSRNIDVSAFPKGLYLLEVKGQAERSCKKFVLQ